MAKKIISVSRRTDISAFYSKWFMNRVRAGYCTVVNPFNSKQVAWVGLKPEDVMIFVFWTRNSAPLMEHLADLNEKGFNYYFQYTLTGYPKALEPHLPATSHSIETFQKLSKKIGKEKVIWRYDPILLSSHTDLSWHKNNFTALASDLGAFTDRVVISIIDPYKKTTSRLGKTSEIDMVEGAYEIATYDNLIKHIADTARKCGIKEVQTCAEEEDLMKYGITRGKCIDDTLIERITGNPISSKKDPSQRKACGCIVSKDIGANNTCLFGCKYCYATRSLEMAKKNRNKHNPDSPSLLGWHDAEPKTSKWGQAGLVHANYAGLFS